MIGSLGFPRIDTNIKTGEIGYWLAEIYQGNGYMIEGVNALVDYVYTHFDWENLIIRADKLNTSSCKVAERCGFTLDGILRKNEFLKGKFEDIAQYSFTREDYFNKK